MKKIFFILFMLMGGFLKAATVEGIVSDDAGNPLQNSRIEIMSSGYSTFTFTNGSGYYGFNVSTGIYSIKAILSGYLPITQIRTVILPAGIYQNNFFLPPDVLFYAPTGNVLNSTGAVFGSQAWDSAVSITADDSGNSYVLGRTHPRTYVVKYGSSGVFLSSATLSPEEYREYSKIIWKNGYVYVFGRTYESDTYNYRPFIVRLASNLSFVGDGRHPSSTSVWYGSLNSDASNIYSCYNDGSNFYVHKMNFDLSYSSGTLLPGYCQSLAADNLGKISLAYNESGQNKLRKLNSADLTNDGVPVDDVININNPSWLSVSKDSGDLFSAYGNYVFDPATNQNVGWGVNVIKRNSALTFVSSFTFINPGNGEIYNIYADTHSNIFALGRTTNERGDSDYMVLVAGANDFAYKGLFIMDGGYSDYPADFAVDISSKIYVTGSSYVERNDFSNDDIRTVKFNPSVITNRKPNLFWINSGNYYNNGVQPNAGSLGQSFSFKVRYQDLDNDASSYIRVKIYKDGSEIIGSPFNMVYETGVSPLVGLIYKYDFTPVQTGYYSYLFEAADYRLDGSSLSAGGYPVTQISYGPSVAEGFAGNLALSTGASFSQGGNLEPMDISIVTGTAGDNVYALIKENGLPYLIRFSTSSSMVSVSSAIYSLDPYYAERIFSDRDNQVYLAGITNIAGINYVDLRRYDKNFNNTAAVLNNLPFVGNDPFEIKSADVYYNGVSTEIYILGRSGNPASNNFNAHWAQFDNTLNYTFTARYYTSVSTIIPGNFPDFPADMKLDSVGNIFITGYYFDTDKQNNDIFVAKFDKGNSYTVSSFTFTSCGLINDDRASGIAIDSSGNVFVAGTINNGQANNIAIFKLDNNLNLLDSRIFNAGDFEESRDIVVTPSSNVYVSIFKVDNDMGRYIRKSMVLAYSTDLVFKSSAVYGADYSEDNFPAVMAANSSDQLYLLGLKNIFQNAYSASKITAIKPQFVFSNPTLSVNTVNKNSLAPMSGMNIGLLSFNSKGLLDPSFMDIGQTNPSGNISFQAAKGISYLITVSTPGFGPKVKDQVSDPYGNFNKTLYSNIVSSYTFSPIASGTNTVRVNISGVFRGAFLIGEIYLLQNNERLAYGILKATSAASVMEMHNVPALQAGTYGINISMPGWAAKNITPQSAIPAVSSFNLNMLNSLPPSSNYTQTTSTTAVYFSGLINSSSGTLSAVRVRVYNNCGPSGCTFEQIGYSDLNGRFSFSGLPSSMAGQNLYYEITKQGYAKIPGSGPAVSFINSALNMNFFMQPATYTLSGFVRYMGSPMAYMRLYLSGEQNYYANNNDSYMRDGNIPANIGWVEVFTDGDGYFSASGLTDGNVNLTVNNPIYKNINSGSNIEDPSDNLRITISSSSAFYTPSYPCIAGKAWVLDSSGTCKGVMPYTFDIGVGVSTNAVVTGNLIFSTTYTVTALNPLIISKSSSVVVALFEESDDWENKKSFYATVVGTYTSNIVPYSISVSSWNELNSSPRMYYVSVLSNSWAKLSSFDSMIAFSSGTLFNRDINLVKAGRLTVSVKNPDGSLYSKPNDVDLEISIEGKNISYRDDHNINSDGTYDFYNIPGGKFKAALKFETTGYAYVPLELDDITVNEGKTTNITFTLKTGLFVEPQIYGLPEISTSSWAYIMVAVPSGQIMNGKYINQMFFKNPMYVFNYDQDSSSWDKLSMPEGQFDFYLALASRYCTPDDSDCGTPNYNNFMNFIGSAKGMSIKADPTNPNIGTLSQPIAVNILGSIGQNQISGIGKGSNVFSNNDYEKIFANFDQIIELLSSVMLYDASGELRAFSNIMPNGTALLTLMNSAIIKDSATINASILGGEYGYLVWGLPPGRYTAVFLNHNYPPIARNITLPGNEVFDFNYDDANVSAGNIRGIVRSSSSVSSLLANAQVYIKGRTMDKYALSDSSGVFSFTNMPAGAYKLEISMDGFVKQGKKFALSKDENLNLGSFYMAPSTAVITGKIYVSKFPTPTVKEGVKVSAYDETLNVNEPQSYLPIIDDLTDALGIFELKGVLPGHNYRVVVTETGKMTYSTITYISSGIQDMGEIALIDLPPQIVVKVRKDPDNERKVNVIIKSPRELVSIPVCKYTQGTEYISTNAVSLGLVPAANNTFMGQFTTSISSRYYSIYVSAGDSSKLEKTVIYDTLSNSKTEQFIQDASYIGGSIYMDSEKEEYSGLELDAGALTQTSTATIDLSDLTGGFFSAMPNVRTIKTNRGTSSIADVIKNIMASEVYDIDLSNAQPNKSFNLTLKYDKEKAASSGALKIYQYDSSNDSWKEVPGTYDIDPSLGVVSVSVDSIVNASNQGAGGSTPMSRKVHSMSAISPKGYYVPSATSPSSQTGKFAVFSAKPPAGVIYSGSSYEIYNMPNPFNLKDKTVAISDGWSGVSSANYSTRGTIIKYFLPSSKGGNVKLVIYNMAGEKVRTLEEGSRAGGQVYYSEWDGKNDNNENCASGVYLLMTYVDGNKLGNKAHKMAIIK